MDLSEFTPKQGEYALQMLRAYIINSNIRLKHGLTNELIYEYQEAFFDSNPTAGLAVMVIRALLLERFMQIFHKPIAPTFSDVEKLLAVQLLKRTVKKIGVPLGENQLRLSIVEKLLFIGDTAVEKDPTIFNEMQKFLDIIIEQVALEALELSEDFLKMSP